MKILSFFMSLYTISTGFVIKPTNLITKYHCTKKERVYYDNHKNNLLKSIKNKESEQKILFKAIKLSSNTFDKNYLENWGHEEKLISGTWSLIFSNANDAMIPDTQISQIISSKENSITNIVHFSSRKLKELRVSISAEKKEANTLDLRFKKFTIYRKSRFGPKKISIPIPNIRFIYVIVYNLMLNTNKTKKPFNTILYVDEDLLVKQSSEGKIYISKKKLE